MSNNRQCQEFENRIQDLLDLRGSLLNDSMLARHARDCSACGDLLNDYQTISNSFDLFSSNSETLQAGHDRPKTSEKVLISNSISHPHNHTAGRIFASLAALLLVAVGFYFVALEAQPQQAQLAVDLLPAVVPPTESFANYDQIAIADIVPSLVGPLEEATSVLGFPNSFRSSTIDEMVSMQQRRREVAQRLVQSGYQWNDILPDYRPTISELVDYPASLTPNWVSHTSAPWQRFSKQIEPLGPYWQMTSDLPSIRPLQNSVQLTIDLLQQSLQM